MRERLKVLQRLLNIYETIEDVCEAEAKRTSGEVHQAQDAIGRQDGVVREAMSEEREALAGGDRLEWMYAALRKEVAGTRKVRLARVLIEREERKAAAYKDQMSSTQWSERMKQLVSGIRTGFMEQEDRREQAASDDRYLARRARETYDAME